MIDYKDFGARIRAERRKKYLTQEKLAEMVGISASFMGHVERGSRIASIETLVELCNALEVSPQLLLQGSLKDAAMSAPTTISPQERSQINHLLRLAQDTISNWEE